MKTFKIFTLGCKVNQYDTQVVREQFLIDGYRETTNRQTADIYVINTCTVTASADKKSRYYINFAHRQNPRAKVIVTGCYAQQNSYEISLIPGVTDIVRLNQKTGSVSDFQGHTRAFLKIQDGCNNSCAYCKVHLARGKSRSKPLKDLVVETRNLMKNGFKEIVLCGVCLGAYGRDLNTRTNLVDAIAKLEDIDGLLRLRLSSIEAWDVTDELIKKISQSEKFCPHLHIPIQSGDDFVLRRMNRKASFALYANLIKAVKKKIPEAAISTDIIVGFPGEEEKHFQKTLELMDEIKPMKIHIFPYSPRPGTPAFAFRERINYREIHSRIITLKEIAEKYESMYRKNFKNKKMKVLFEGRVKNKYSFWEGHTENYLKVYVHSKNNLKNKIKPVKLEKIKPDYILGSFV